MIAVYSAVKGLFNTVASPFKTAIGGRFRYGEALPGWELLDYAVYFGVSNVPDDFFDTELTEVSFQVSCYSVKASHAQQNMEMAASFFNGARLSINNFQDMVLRRSMLTPAIKDGHLWLSAVEFEGRCFKL